MRGKRSVRSWQGPGGWARSVPATWGALRDISDVRSSLPAAACSAHPPAWLPPSLPPPPLQLYRGHYSGLVSTWLHSWQHAAACLWDRVIRRRRRGLAGRHVLRALAGCGPLPTATSLPLPLCPVATWFPLCISTTIESGQPCVTTSAPPTTRVRLGGGGRGGC